jgi:single-strand DNA-binding protein
MSLGINKVILLGEVSDTPACKTTNSGLSVANINLATVESWVDKKTGDTRKRTEWHRVVFFNHHAKIIATSVQQGAQLYVCGSNQTSKWEKDGITRYTTKIIGNELQILGIKNQESAKLNEAPLPGHKETSDWNIDNSKDDWDFDDVPF